MDAPPAAASQATPVERGNSPRAHGRTAGAAAEGARPSPHAAAVPPAGEAGRPLPAASQSTPLEGGARTGPYSAAVPPAGIAARPLAAASQATPVERGGRTRRHARPLASASAATSAEGGGRTRPHARPLASASAATSAEGGGRTRGHVAAVASAGVASRPLTSATLAVRGPRRQLARDTAATGPPPLPTRLLLQQAAPSPYQAPGDGRRLSAPRPHERAAGAPVIREAPVSVAPPPTPPIPSRCAGSGMEVRRQLLPVLEVCEDGQRDGCAMDSADIHVRGEGMETRDTVNESVSDTICGCEDNAFFDLGTGDDSSSEDGEDSKLDDTDSSTNTSSPLKGNHAGGVEANYAKKDGNVGDRCEKGVDFWSIASKTFASEDEAFTFYNSYAKDKGFSVRKEKVRRLKRSREIVFRRFVCSKEGERDGKWLGKENYSRRPRALTRCDCSALLDIRLDTSRGVWFVNDFVDEHNHRLAMPDEVPFLWSHRKMKDFHRNEIMSLESAGVRKHVIRDVLQCRYGGYDKVGIVTKDIYNFCSKKKRSRIAQGDARTVLDAMRKKKNDNPDFYFDYKVGDDNRLMSLFWCDTQSRMDYQSFGDVVVFDSTYRMNRYKMPFVPFVGLNHHRNTTVFGCGIICDECAESYVWVLQAFMKAMCQKKPQSVITDGDYSMIKAIRQVLPGVSHRICSWHVEKNMMKHLHARCLVSFRKLLYYVSSESFEARWNTFICQYERLQNRDWLAMMYKNRKLWAAAFQSDKYFLGMKSNQRSESLNSSLHKHLDIYMSLLDLVQHYDNCVSHFRETEGFYDCKSSQSKPVPLTKHKEIEVDCSDKFTAANFYLLQHELRKITDYHIQDRIVAMDSSRYFLVHNENNKSVFLVDYWTDNSGVIIQCSCRKMERDGLPCTHIFHILGHLKIYEMPKCCMLQRHLKDAKVGLPSKRKSSLYVWTTKRARYSELTVLGAEAFDVASKNHEQFSGVKEYLGDLILKKPQIDHDGTEGQSSGHVVDQTCHTRFGSVLDPIIAVNKGAPKKNSNGPKETNIDGFSKKRYKSFVEKRQYRCTVCKQEGHNKTTCAKRVEQGATDGEASKVELE